MSAEMLETLQKQMDLLTVDEQLRLVAYLAEKARAAYPPPRPRRKWREIRGIAKSSLFGEDAQSYITRTRQEDTEQRELQLRREP
jgi:hypothetical protein